MQIFIPYSDVIKTALCLDISRLNKQILEVIYIRKCVNAFRESGDTSCLKHPVMKMYKDYPEWLKYYQLALESVFHKQPFNAKIKPEFIPPFLSYQPLLDCHRKRLYQKGLKDQARRKQPHNHYECFSAYASDNEENMYIFDNTIFTYLNGKVVRTEPIDFQYLCQL